MTMVDQPFAMLYHPVAPRITSALHLHQAAFLLVRDRPVLPLPRPTLLARAARSDSVLTRSTGGAIWSTFDTVDSLVLKKPKSANTSS